MKLADDFLVKCLNYETEYQKFKEELKDLNHNNYYFSRHDIECGLNSIFFEVEEKDFIVAIELCKEFKRSIQKKAYEHKLKQFKETGTYARAGNPAKFIDDLRSELVGNRRYSYEKQMVVDEELSNRFPEMNEINAARQILKLVRITTKFEEEFSRAQENLQKHQASLTTFAEGVNGGKSPLEIVEQLSEHEDS